MSFQTQHNVGELIGSLASRPDPATLSESGTLYHTDDGNGTFILRAFANSASNVWDPIGGPAGSTGPTGPSGPTGPTGMTGSVGATGQLGWPKYVVATPAGPTAPFTSIQAAINAAVTDGHGPSASAVVLIHPGTYTEDVALADGVHLAGFSDNDDAGVVLTGDLTTTGGSNDISSLNVDGSVVVSGSDDVALILRKVRVVSGTATSLDVSSTAESSEIAATDCSFEASDAGAEALSITGGSFVTADRCAFSNVQTASVAIAGGGGDLSFRRCSFVGRFQFTGPSGALFSDCDFAVDSQAVMSLNGGGSQTLFRPRIQQTGTPATMFEGASPGLAYDDVTGFVPANFFNVATGVATSALAVARAHTRAPFFGTGPHAPDVAIADLSVVAPPVGGTATFVMPLTRNLSNGLRVTVRQINTTGHTVVEPTGGSGDTIDGLATLNLGTGTHGVELQNDPSSQTWIITVLF